MKLSRTLVLPIAAAALVVVGAGAVLATTGPLMPAPAALVPAAAPTPATGTAVAPRAPFLTKVLDGLVTKGTITGTQEQAIVDAWIGARTARGQELQANRQQLRTFLSDGVLTADELAKLPADSPLQQLKPLMKNGQLTMADLRSLGRGILRDLRMGGAGGVGRGMLGQPAPTPATGG